MPSLSPLMSKIVFGALGAAGSFIFGGVTTALISDTINYDFLPFLYKHRFGANYVLEVYDDADLAISANGNKRDALVRQFSLYMPTEGEKISGRLVRRDENGEDKSGTDDIYYISGFRNGNTEIFSWTKVKSPSDSVGAFIGRYDRESGSYVGSVVAQSRAENSSECVLRRQWAIVGPEKSKNRFPNIIIDFYNYDTSTAKGVGWTNAYKNLDRAAELAKIKDIKNKAVNNLMPDVSDNSDKINKACK